MMVCGSIVSSDALAGAVSGSKAVPVTTTVSIPPALRGQDLLRVGRHLLGLGVARQ